MNKNTPLILKQDAYLKPYAEIIRRRYQKGILRELDFTDGKQLLKDCFNNYLYFGIHKTSKSWLIREWAPAAHQLYLIGDFSFWRLNEQYAFQRQDNGEWCLELPLSFLKHYDLYKILMATDEGLVERLPAYVTRVVQDDETKVFSAQIWDPPKPYQWQYSDVHKPDYMLIYEAHIGMSSENEVTASYHQFKMNVLHRIKELGYNTIQLMGIQEHPYYGSFGYQVSNFFAPSSRFGTPDELKELIDESHRMGLYVILDIVHSHSVANEKEGLGKFDGTEDLYFHKGDRGWHPAWKSRCFDYGKQEVLGFLLSNLKYWQEEFHFDGFRFDGVTSMIYWDHGLGVDFLSYKQYFDGNQDEDALTYLYLANRLVHEVNSDAITIAEEVSGYPGTGVSCQDGGLGFDYRMSMGIADFWIKEIKEVSDEAWNPGDIFYRLTDKRSEENTVSYAECHDQAMVGDQTIIFRLIGADMYGAMSLENSNLKVDRGIALYKLILFSTVFLAHKGFLNFMGNEFGHPEWIDFPRVGNQWSYHYARRQWSLSENSNLKYALLLNFHKIIIAVVNDFQLYNYSIKVLKQDAQDQILAFERGPLLLVMNFSPSHSYTDYPIEASQRKYKIITHTDKTLFGGFNRINDDQTFIRLNDKEIRLYLPVRTAIVLQSC